MHDNPIPGRAAEALSREAEDGVFRRVLDLHPARLGERELARSLALDALALRCETYEGAIEALVRDRLLRREGDRVHPTRAAIRAEAVER